MEKIKKIMKETCFNSLAYCCGLEKKCKKRDAVMKKIGLTRKNYIKLKELFDFILFYIN